LIALSTHSGASVCPFQLHSVSQRYFHADELTFQPCFIEEFRSFIDFFHDPIDLGCDNEKNEKEVGKSKGDQLMSSFVVPYQDLNVPFEKT
jgi:hypothetical protein